MALQRYAKTDIVLNCVIHGVVWCGVARSLLLQVVTEPAVNPDPVLLDLQLLGIILACGLRHHLGFFLVWGAVQDDGRGVRSGQTPHSLSPTPTPPHPCSSKPVSAGLRGRSSKL